MKYIVSKQARQDLAEIWEYIAKDSPLSADRLIDSILNRFETLAKNPHLGRAREELKSGIRSLAEEQYLIFYRVASPGVRVVRVLHGRRDITSLLKN